MSKHIGYIAAKPSDLPDLIHAPEQVSLRVYPDIVSASGSNLVTEQGASVYEATIELAGTERFYGGGEYTGRGFDTFMDAFDYATSRQGQVEIESGDEHFGICSRVKLGPRVVVVGW